MDTKEALAHAGLIARSTDTVDLEGKPAKRLTASRTYDTTIDDLWDAVTSPERISRWFLPVSGQLETGGRYDLEGNASGSVLECDPPNRFDITWEYGGDTSWVTVEVSPDDDGARLDLTHVAHVPEEMWDQYGPGAAGVGWDLALMGLDIYLSTGHARPGDASAWETSPEGRAFIARASQAWAEASIASGTDPEAAHASAKRVTAFYTGE